MNRFLKLFLAFTLAAAPAVARPADPDPRSPLIQIALLLDTSNSMDGLIGQAKSRLWRIVNDLASARRYGRAPRIEVALYHYGDNRIPAGENHVRQVLPFTDDLDVLSDRLFALTTNGGEEYCGAVIEDAARNLSWDGRDGVYKTIFIAGNEPFTQGRVDFRDAVQRAVGRGILVNAIFCGDRREGVQTKWKEGADRGRGSYFAIDQDDPLIVARTPYDDEIERLGARLNDTYVALGGRGRKMLDSQSRADSLAARAAPAGASVERSLYKAKSQYADAVKESDAVSRAAAGASVEEMRAELPAPLQGMDDRSLETHLKAKAEEREMIQKKLERLGKSRAAHLAGKSAGAKDTLDRAVIEAVRAQAAGKSFVFEK